MGAPFSIIIPVKDDAANLERCLRSVCDFDDVVVVDSRSADGTCDVAEAQGRKVVEFDWNLSFPKKRNWALRTCTFKYPWVLFLDADERMTTEFAEEASSKLLVTSCNAFWVKYKNHFLGRSLRYGDGMRKLALLRIGHGEFEHVPDDGWTSLDMEVHEQLVVRGAVGRFSAQLEHFGKGSLREHRERHGEYATWEARRFLALRSLAGLTGRQRIKYGLLSCPLFPALYFAASYVCKCGFLDGAAGFWYAVNKAVYFRQIQVKVAALKAHGLRGSEREG